MHAPFDRTSADFGPHGSPVTPIALGNIIIGTTIAIGGGATTTVDQPTGAGALCGFLIRARSALGLSSS